MRNSTWTIEKIKAGFEYFYKEYGRLPTAPEIDQLQYLPSSRWIQLQFGGLEKLRALFGYEYVHFGKGIFRSVIAKKVNVRGRTAEQKLEAFLNGYFGEVFVHAEKMFDTTQKNRIDFYIYSQNDNFGIDVFFPDTLKTLSYNVNSKMNKYKNFLEKIYLVVANDSITQHELNSFCVAKKNTLPKNIELLTLDSFFTITKQKVPYTNPLINSDNI